ncbi:MULTISPECIES: hypothetical protein [Streptomyces]|uniref:hypothetical protein n=1 Tax=Streptomyces TaxID=1883 RepID=UPI0004CB7966|nr:MULTISPECIES: hypothetical protein [Streptomyces]MDX3608202.1 hypothetical protein [Streptomyces sp. FL06-04B]MDX3734610.1 hypothetical protein [Streptomyces sp. ID01-15D]
MPDRRRRTAFRFPRPERSALLMRERQSSSPDSGSAGKPQEDNPFAAPPADRPDQPWQPRRPSGSQGQGSDGQDDNGSGSDGDRPAWGSQWSDRQPGRGSGGFGGRPGGNGAGGPGGKGGNDRGGPGGLRWDPTDPAQRRARYAVLGGMWAFFFALFDFPEIALLLGALATYWAISALRTPLKNASPTDRTAVDGGSAGTPANPAAPGSPAAPASPASPSNVSSRQQTTAAVGGLVTALLALLIVATSYTVQLVYRDYYTCVNDALTKSASVACNDKLPKPLEPFFGVKE